MPQISFLTNKGVKTALIVNVLIVEMLRKFEAFSFIDLT